MKKFFWFIVFVIVLGMVFLFGNNLRCVSKEYNLGCPELCTFRSVKCDRNINPRCKDGYRCVAPELKQYPRFIQFYLNKNK
jgi:hypothetical protein